MKRGYIIFILLIVMISFVSAQNNQSDCLKEGVGYDLLQINGSGNCCEGLVPSNICSIYVTIGDECYKGNIDDFGVGCISKSCVKCGDGNCSEHEDICVCPQDCKGKKESEYKNYYDLCKKRYDGKCSENRTTGLCGLCSPNYHKILYNDNSLKIDIVNGVVLHQKILEENKPYFEVKEDYAIKGDFENYFIVFINNNSALIIHNSSVSEEDLALADNISKLLDDLKVVNKIISSDKIVSNSLLETIKNTNFIEGDNEKINPIDNNKTKTSYTVYFIITGIIILLIILFFIFRKKK